MSPEILVRWEAIYRELSKDEGGKIGALLARSETHVIRLSMLYAILDCSRIIKSEHLEAAYALWKYCEQSVRYVFAEETESTAQNHKRLPKDRLRDELQKAQNRKLTRTEIMKNVFQGNKTAREIDLVIDELILEGIVRHEYYDGAQVYTLI